MNRRFLLKLAGSLLLFLFFFLIFLCIAFQCESDLPEHAKMAVLGLREGLLYSLMNICSGYSYNLNDAIIACCFLLSISKVFLFWIVFLNMKKQFGEILSFAVSFSLLFVNVVSFNLLLGHFHFYFGYLVPNVWHNSTIIFSMPFCFLIYIYSLRLLEKTQWKQAMLLGLLVLICIFIKPSFFFVYSCSYSLVVIYKFCPNIRKILSLLLPIFIGFGAVIYQYVTIYDGSDGSSVAIDFSLLYSYDYWSVYGIYVLFSFIFPFLFFVLNRKRIGLNSEFCFVCLMLLFSICIMLVFKETGPRAGHGNFYWQVIPAMWIMYFYIIKTELGFIKIYDIMIRSKGPILLLGYYALAFIYGLFYLSYYLYSGIYD